MLARLVCRCASFRLPCASSSSTASSVRVASVTARRSQRFYSTPSSSDSGSSNSGRKSPENGNDDSKPGSRRVFKARRTEQDAKESGPAPIDIIGEKLLDAVGDVAKELHKDDPEMRKKTKKELIAKLAEHEKETFRSATESQITEFLSDSAVVDLLADLNASSQPPKRASRAAEIRHAQRGLVLLRREIFSQAQQDGFTASEARVIAEKAVTAAEERAKQRSRLERDERKAEETKQKEVLSERTDKERKLYDYAFRMAEQMLYPSLQAAAGRGVAIAVEPDCTIPNIFASEGARLDVFTESDVERLKPHSLTFWAESDARALKIWSQSFGPKNGFEEMIELTKKGKMWPYPIDNEYLFTEEENVGFHEHIFLEQKLSEYDLPKSGPIAHFMELVCVGLSKNPYMTVQKKHSHIDWFANYFIEKREEIERLHKKEQLAAGVS